MDEWDSVSAFRELFELEHVCEILRENAAVPPECRESPVYLTGDKSPLIEALSRQARYSEKVIETVRSGLYQRTWIAEVFRRLWYRLDAITEFPERLADELHDIELDLHKILIAAHDVHDPEHRAKLAADAEAKGIQAGLVAAENRRSEQSRAAVAERADQKERKDFLEWGALAAGTGADTVEELQSLPGFNPEWSRRDLSTLRKWAKEAGFKLKTGRPRKRK